MTVNTDRVLRITRHFDASPERVFDAWLNPADCRQMAVYYGHRSR